MSASAPPPNEWPQSLRALGSEHGVVSRQERAFLPLLEAPTGRAFGLSWALEGEGGVDWAYLAEDEVVACGPEAVATGERRFVELIERPRREVEDELDAAATRLSLDVGEVLRSLPSVVWVSAVLASRHDHLCRLGLGWLLPSELRAARPAIAAVAADEKLQIGVRQLAQRLVVAEDEP